MTSSAIQPPEFYQARAAKFDQERAERYARAVSFVEDARAFRGDYLQQLTDEQREMLTRAMDAAHHFLTEHANSPEDTRPGQPATKDYIKWTEDFRQHVGGFVESTLPDYTGGNGVKAEHLQAMLTGIDEVNRAMSEYTLSLRQKKIIDGDASQTVIQPTLSMSRHTLANTASKHGFILPGNDSVITRR